MKPLDMFFLILTVASLLGLRIWQVPPWRGTSTWWDETEKYRLQNMGLLLGLTILLGFASITWWMGLILLLPILAVCVWSLSAAYDWDDTTNTGSLYNALTWGANRNALKWRLRIRLYTVGGIAVLLVITWISMAITGALGDGGGSANNAQPPATSTPATQAPVTTSPTTQATPSAPPTSSPAAVPTTSTTKSSKGGCMADIPVDKAVDETFNTTMGNSLDVCHPGHDWITVASKNGEKVRVFKWVQDGTYEYDLIPLDGKQVWIRVPYVK